jgi:Flp pilus assembly protein TadG
MQVAVHRPWAPGMARGRRGQSLVEMAITLPLLLLLVAGVLDLAHAFSVAGVLQNSAREGARYGATKPTDIPGIQDAAVQEAAGAPLTVDSANVTVTYSDFGATTGHPITVQVTAQVDLLLSNALGLPPPNLRRTSTMVIF